jgi:diacylglycerol O-acyltransferase
VPAAPAATTSVTAGDGSSARHLPTGDGGSARHIGGGQDGGSARHLPTSDGGSARHLPTGDGGSARHLPVRTVAAAEHPRLVIGVNAGSDGSFRTSCFDVTFGPAGGCRERPTFLNTKSSSGPVAGFAPEPCGLAATRTALDSSARLSAHALWTGRHDMERLSALDTEFLHLEDGVEHMVIAGMSVFGGRPPTEPELQALLTSKLHLIPRYRQRVRSVPLELGRPVWVDDPHFNLDYHVRTTALVEPADDAVCRLMGRLMSQELDRNRPLWEVWIVHGLPDGRWALVSKLHHCMVDGVAGVGLLEALLDITPDVQPEAPRPWRPAPEPSAVALVADAWGGLLGDVAGRVRHLPGRVRDPVGTLKTIGATGQGLIGFGRRLVYTPPLSIEGSIGPHRVWAHSSATLDDVRRIRKNLGGTVNDVVLAAVTNGYRELLLARGEDVDTAVLRTLVPVSVRTEDAKDIRDNRVSAILCELPVDIADPVARLAAVRDRMTDLKGSHMAEAGGAVTSFANLLPPMLVGNTTRVLLRATKRRPQRFLNTVTTNVRGPQFPIYCLGREMLEHRPFVPISHGVRIGTAILSYNGLLAFGVTGDFDTAPDVGVVAEGITAGIDELVERT